MFKVARNYIFFILDAKKGFLSVLKKFEKCSFLHKLHLTYVQNYDDVKVSFTKCSIALSWRSSQVVFRLNFCLISSNFFKENCETYDKKCNNLLSQKNTA